MAEKTPEEQFKEWMNSQGDYVGKENKAQWWNDYNTNVQSQGRLNNVFNPNQAGLYGVSGSPQEISGRLDGLERAKVLTGQNPTQIGQDYQEAYGNIKKRTQMADTGSELLRASKAGAVADSRNQLQAQGVKGGAALGAVESVERAKSYDVNNQLMDAQQKAQGDYMNAAKANANFTNAAEMNYGAMAAGRDAKAPVVSSNGFGTVICTELYKNGYFSKQVYQADTIYGFLMKEAQPEIYRGYRFLADPIVSLMQKSKLFTKIVALFAVPWANNMAGNSNLIGEMVSIFGEPLCWVVGKIIGEQYVEHKEKI